MSKSYNSTDVILVADRCYTLQRRPQTVQALALASGRVVASGTARDVLKLRRPGTRVRRYPGAVITPGLVDCHTHFFYWALGESLVIELSDLRSWDAVSARIRKQAGRKRVGEWVMARGFDRNWCGNILPTAVDLDRLVPDAPLMIHGRDGHSAYLNTPALQRCGLVPDRPDPKGGRYLRDEHGRPNGIVQETAINDLPDPLRDLAQRTDAGAVRTVDAALDRAYRVARSVGLTGVHTMDDGVSLGHLLRHRQAGRLGLRVVHAIPLAEFENAVRLGLRSGLGDEWLRIGGIKIFSDGSLGSQTAYMLDAYPDRPGFHGVPVIAGDELKDTVARIAQCGWAAWVHAIGDRAVRETVAALAAAGRRPACPLPHRIEHVQCIRPTDVRRMARAGIVASVQPCHLPGDIATAERYWPHVRQHTYAFRRLIDAGVALAAGSDVPIESLDPRKGLFAAVVRTDEAGVPAGGWVPKQRISVSEALWAFTRGAAGAAGRPEPAGTLAPGAAADLTIWADDPMRVEPAALREVGVITTLVAGEEAGGPSV